MSNLHEKLWRPVGNGGSTTLATFLTQLGELVARRPVGTTDPRPAIAQLKALNLGAVRLPPDLGGEGFTLRELFSLVIDIAALDPDVAHILRTHYWFTEEFLTYADRPAADRWIDRIRHGAIIGNAASELGGGVVSANIEGRNTQPIRTTLSTSADGRSLTLNGSKFYSTGSMYSDWILVMALDAQDEGKWVGVRADAPGVVHEDDWDGIGQRGTGSGTTRFVDAAVDAADVLPIDFTRAYAGSFTQLYLLAVATGIAQAIVADAVAHLRKRARNYTHGINPVAAEDPILQVKIGELSAAAFAAEAVVLAAADALDRLGGARIGTPAHEAAAHDAALAVSRAQIALQPLLLASASDIFEIGGSSVSRQREQLDRHWRNIRTITTHNTLAFRKYNVGAYDVLGTKLPLNGFF